MNGKLLSIKLGGKKINKHTHTYIYIYKSYIFTFSNHLQILGLLRLCRSFFSSHSHFWLVCPHQQHIAHSLTVFPPGLSRTGPLYNSCDHKAFAVAGHKGDPWHREPFSCTLQEQPTSCLPLSSANLSSFSRQKQHLCLDHITVFRRN